MSESWVLGCLGALLLCALCCCQWYQVCQDSTMFPPRPQHWLSYPALVIHLLNLGQWHDMAWQTTCCVRWKTSPQIFYNPHKSKQNLTTCSVWQKCTRPLHTSLYSPTRLTPPNTLRIQRLIQSNIPMFSSASTCQLHGFMLTVQHVFNNCGCENPYCDTVWYSDIQCSAHGSWDRKRVAVLFAHFWWQFLHDQDQEGWHCKWLKAKIHNKRNSKKRRNISHIIVYHIEQCDL